MSDQVRAIGPPVVLGAGPAAGPTAVVGRGVVASGPATVIGGGGGATSLGELSDVDTTGAATGQVLVRGDDGVWYPQTPTAAPQWGDAVAFSATAPDPDTAPESAVWVQLDGDLTIYRKAP